MIPNKTVFRPKMNRRIRFCCQNFEKMKLASEKTRFLKTDCFKMERAGNRGNGSQTAKRGVTPYVGANTPCKQVGNY